MTPGAPLTLGHLAVREFGLASVALALSGGIVWALRRTFGGPKRAVAPGGWPAIGRRDVYLVGGLAALVVAVSGPVDRYADRLFWVHMSQHVVLITVAAPLIALGEPWRFVPRSVAVRWADRTSRSATGAILPGAIAAWVVFNVTFLVFHVPALYDSAIEHLAVHLVEHAVFLGTAVWFWAVAFDARSFRSDPTELWRAGYVLAAASVGWVLAIFLTFAPEPLYREYARLGSRPGGISAMADQQLAAGIMLVPGSITFLVVAGFALSRWLGADGSDDTPPFTVSHEEMSA